MHTARPSPLPLRQTAFHNPRLARPGVEVMSLADLWPRTPSPTMARPERVDFFMLLLVERGRGMHMVDFCELDLQAGSLVFVQPGQVQQWMLPSQLQGTLLLVDPAVMNPVTLRSVLQQTLAREWSTWPSHRLLPLAGRRVLREAMRLLAVECTAFDGSDISVALLRSLLACVLLRTARAHAQPGAAPGAGPGAGADAAGHAGEAAVLRLFKAALERHLRTRPTVHSLAAELGYSVSTLNRACMALEGRSAKALIDNRVVLEAQRLLVHSSDAAGQIGLALGFSEPTNFHKFFKRVAGATPEAFRQRYAMGA